MTKKRAIYGCLEQPLPYDDPSRWRVKSLALKVVEAKFMFEEGAKQ
jgi:hypothetical protein